MTSIDTTPTPAPAAQPAPPLFWVITVQTEGRTVTQEGTYNPSPGKTRQDAFGEIFASVKDGSRMSFGVVLFFFLEPNQL